ncbi:hypothetical protein [Arachidicoccus ginsenosidimutans]|uniref:hypothetical protein n=1 Tax=Arachidicoccus sp. BS20 TaxID=1850526 RepID=UPI0035120A5E
MPCKDTYTKTNAAIATISQTDNSHTTNPIDDCSPFCICNCCSSTVALKAAGFFLPLSKPVITTKRIYPIRDFSFISNFYGNIWQPPKISA